MCWIRRARVIGGCLISIGFVLGAGLIFTAAIADPKCPTGQVWNPVSNKCSPAGKQCPPGQVANPTTKLCGCLAGQALDAQQKCVALNCTNGYVLNPAQTGCVPLECSAGSVPNAQKNGCVALPSITSISPPGGGAGTTVTINGTGYAAGATVAVGDAQLGMAQATKITVISPTQITAVVPPGRSLSANEATTVNVQVTVAGQTSKAAVFSYCSSVTEYSPTQNKCVPLPPTCGQNCPSAQTYKNIQFVIWTGGDDLRGDSDAWAFLAPHNGAAIYCQLHSGGNSWPNGSINTIPCSLGNNTMTLAQLQNVPIAIAFNGHRNIQNCVVTACESQDNWNLFSVLIQAFNEGQSPVYVLCAVGFPLHRFVLTDSASPTFNDHQPNIQADDGIWVTSFPSSILHITPPLQPCGSVSPGATPP